MSARFGFLRNNFNEDGIKFFDSHAQVFVFFQIVNSSCYRRCRNGLRYIFYFITLWLEKKTKIRIQFVDTF